MSKLSEERDNATRMIALRKWAELFTRDHKRDPSVKEIMAFIQVLNEKVAPSSPEALINLIEKEKKVRVIAEGMARKSGVDPAHFILNLKPNPQGTTIVKGGHPSVIELGILPGDINFLTILRRMVMKAEKLYVPSALILSSKILEYDRDINRFKTWKGDPDYYPLLPVDRIQVATFEMVRVIDMVTGESITRSRQVEQGMFSHFKKNQLVQQAHLDLSRDMYATGKLKSDEFEYEREEGKAG